MWTQYKVFCKTYKEEEGILYNLASNLNLLRKKVICWHYLFEHEKVPYLLIRLEYKKSNKEFVESGIEKIIGNIKYDKDDECYSKGEVCTYGEYGWPFFKRHLQSGSEAGLYYRYCIPKESKFWFKNRYIHCFFNQLEMSQVDEMKFSLKFFRNRLKTWFYYKFRPSKININPRNKVK